jgi:hypothetical protein
MKRIITHCGSAHRDEFLGACVALALGGPAEILRLRDLPEDFDPAADLAIDIGVQNDGGILDHHQMPSEPAVCSLTLVLRHFNVEESFRKWHPWLAYTEIFDHQGPFALARKIGADWSLLAPLLSPVETQVLRLFGCETALRPGDPLHDMMTSMGRNWVDHARRAEERLAWLKTHTILLHVGNQAAGFIVMDSRNKIRHDDPELALAEFRRETCPGCAYCVIPDSRSQGLALSRFDDDPRIDFSILDGHPWISFAHRNGFVAKTKPDMPMEELEQILNDAWMGD